MRKKLVAALLVLSLAGCTSSSNLLQVNMTAEFYDMRDEAFSLQVVAPLDVIREYAICKAVWFAEQKNTVQMALSDPIYGGEIRGPISLKRDVPKGWGVLDATAYLSEPKETANPFFEIAEMQSNCRINWEWYR